MQLPTTTKLRSARLLTTARGALSGFLNSWVRATRAVPAISGALIAAALLLGWLPLQGALASQSSKALMVLATVVAGTPILVKAVRAALLKIVSIDLLVSVAAVGALIVGEVWEAAAVTFLFALGHALEGATLDKTRSAISDLIQVAPDRATVMREGQQVEVGAAEVGVGEVVVIKNGDRVPVDGEVIGGAGSVDEASITGESVPAEKTPGNRVFAGTIVASGLLRVRAESVGADTALARIIHRVEEAQEAKAKTQRFMERFAKWYTPGIMGLALLAGLISGSATLGLTLLVIGCPGALVISIPVSIVAGIGRGARDGILVKGGEYLETAARIDTVLLDKTGTLTEGRPTVTYVTPLSNELSTHELLTIAARAEAGSEHPLAKPVIDAAREAGIPVLGEPDESELVPGMGVVALQDGKRVMVGNARLLEREAGEGAQSELIEGALNEADRLAKLGSTPMIVAVDGTPVGVIGVTDRLRPGATELVGALKAGGVTRVIMLTGDVRSVAEAVGAVTGVDEVRAGLLPEEKLAAVQELSKEGRVVAMVGDGVNDAPALATAHVGVAMGAAASPVALETADIALLADDLNRLPEAILLARRTVRNMRQNIVLALVTVALLLAGVLLGRVTMAGGMLVHEGSVLLVILNGMRLLTREPWRNALTKKRGQAPALSLSELS